MFAHATLVHPSGHQRSQEAGTAFSQTRTGPGTAHRAALLLLLSEAIGEEEENKAEREAACKRSVQTNKQQVGVFPDNFAVRPFPHTLTSQLLPDHQG